MNKQIEDEDLSDKIILEVGCGLGRTTRNLASLLSNAAGSQLIVTDVTDKHFDQVKCSLGMTKIEARFIQTDACELAGVAEESVDYVVCNFALCEINSDIGRGTMALARFLSVLKPGGKLFVEEEFPISEASGPAQQSWSLIWRVLKSAFILIKQKPPTNEYHPKVLARICEITGFTDIKWEASIRVNDLSWLDIRLKIIESIMPDFPSPQLGKMFAHLANDILNRARKIGTVEIPIYSLSARKP